MATYGYIRVSSTDQKEDRQVIALNKEGIDSGHIFMDKQSGKDFNRKQYKKMVRKLRQGDVLCIKSIDRLGRNYEEILEQWRFLTKKKGIGIYVLDMPLLDTRKEKNLLATFIADLVLQVLSFVAQSERENIKQRQKEGIAAARQRGVKFGRKARPLSEPFMESYNLWMDGLITSADAIKMSQLAPSSFYKQANKLRADVVICQQSPT